MVQLYRFGLFQYGLKPPPSVVRFGGSVVLKNKQDDFPSAETEFPAVISCAHWERMNVLREEKQHSPLKHLYFFWFSVSETMIEL